MSSPAAQPDWHVDMAAYQRWISEVETPYRASLPNTSGPLISIVMSTFNTPPSYLRAAIESVLAQRYQNWQLCIADDGSSEPATQESLRHFRDRDSRILLELGKTNGGIATATNSAIKLVSGDYTAFLDHDDVLPDHALLCLVAYLQRSPSAALIYSDSDHLDENDQRCRPFFKPAWNRELLLGQNYLNHLTVIRTDLLRQLGGLREGLDGAQDYDLVLRASDLVESEAILHLPHVLYHWRENPDSYSRGDLAAAAAAGRDAVQRHVDKDGATVKPAQGALIHNQVHWKLPEPAPSLTVLVQGISRENIARQIEALEAQTDYPSVRFRPWDSDLSSPPANSLADLVCLFPTGAIPEHPDWLRRLAAQVCRADVACAISPRIDPHTGTALDPPAVLSPAGEIPATPMSRYWGKGKGYYSALALSREVQHATGGILLCRGQLLAAVVSSGELNGGDIHSLYQALCRAAATGNQRVIWTPATSFTAAGAKAEPLQPPAADPQAPVDPNYSANLARCRIPRNPS